MFDINGGPALASDGFVAYHAARTKLISDHFSKWISGNQQPCQIVSLGAGMDTRPFWDEGVKGAQTYIEVDTASVNDLK